jgi:ABC-type multidrug transport system ATPase subunit
MSFVVFQGVCLELGGHQILDEVSFEVAAGESVALTGANGSGKTSLFRCLLGLVPFRGRAIIGGRDVVTDPVAARTQISYLPQKPAFGDARADEVLRFVACVRKLDEARIDEVLEIVDLAANAKERVRGFSGGMQQRLSLAVTLLVDAPLVLLDEPTASLDDDGQVTFGRIISQLRGAGRTLLLASHRPEEIASMTDRTIRLDRGRLSRLGLAALPKGEADEAA